MARHAFGAAPLVVSALLDVLGRVCRPCGGFLQFLFAASYALLAEHDFG